MKKGNTVVITGFLIILAIFGFYYYGNQSPTPTSPENQTSLNSAAPADTTVSGGSAAVIDQARNNGESMWLLFRSTTCVPCVEMQKVFDQLEPNYKGKIRFIAIDVNDRSNMGVLRTWKIQYIPTSFIIDSTGKVSYQNVGVIPVEDLKKELNKVVK